MHGLFLSRNVETQRPRPGSLPVRAARSFRKKLRRGGRPQRGHGRKASARAGDRPARRRGSVVVRVADTDEAMMGESAGPVEVSDSSETTVWIGNVAASWADGALLTRALSAFGERTPALSAYLPDAAASWLMRSGLMRSPSSPPTAVGKVLTVTVRRKPSERGSWALATFAERRAAVAAASRETGRVLLSVLDLEEEGDGASLLAAVSAEIYLCDVCSCQERLRRHGRKGTVTPKQSG
eukprot:COSAG01_NODE_16_length_40091_cov_15.728646_50_plen_239_part_00